MKTTINCVVLFSTLTACFFNIKPTADQFRPGFPCCSISKMKEGNGYALADIQVTEGMRGKKRWSKGADVGWEETGSGEFRRVMGQLLGWWQ